MSSDQSTAHYVEQPRFVLILRAVQVFFALIVLGLTAYTISAKPFFGLISTDPVNFVVFCCIWTFLVAAYLIVTPLFLIRFYNLWAQLALELISCIFWFAGFISLGSWVGDNSTAAQYDYYTDGLIKRGLEKRKGRSGGGFGSSKGSGKHAKWWATAAGGAGLGALIWILFMATFVIFVLAFLKHRSDPEKAHLPKSGLPYSGEKSGHEMGDVPIGQAPTPAPGYTPQYPMQAQTPVYPVASPPPQQTPVYPVGAPPPQQWTQSPPPQQPYGQA